MYRTGGQVNIDLGWFSSAYHFPTFKPMRGIERKITAFEVGLSSMSPMIIGKTGLSWTESSMRLLIGPHWLGTDSPGSWEMTLVPSKSITRVVIAVREVMWITCRWPNLSAVSHLRIRRGCCGRSI